MASPGGGLHDGKGSPPESEVIDLLSDDDRGGGVVEREDIRESDRPPRPSPSSSPSSSPPSSSSAPPAAASARRRPSALRRASPTPPPAAAASAESEVRGRKRRKPEGIGIGSAPGGRRRGVPAPPSAGYDRRPPMAGLVLEEEEEDSSLSPDGAAAAEAVTAESYARRQAERIGSSLPAELYHDDDFGAVPSSIDGPNKKDEERCRCSPAQAAGLSYSTRDGPNLGRPYYHCKRRRCKFFKWAFTAETMRWYRFGPHTGHVMVRDDGFSADDLLQGKVGDCWFLSALAVIAERPDLIMRIFRNGEGLAMNPYGIVEIRLFLDGFWRRVTVDNFLPCVIDERGETDLDRAVRASLGAAGVGADAEAGSGSGSGSGVAAAAVSSRFDPHAISDRNWEVLRDTSEFLDTDRAKKFPFPQGGAAGCGVRRKLGRAVTSDDLAYSKAKRGQLWVPFLEKAYAKSHGSYRAISGGHIAEAFLDLTGAPTLVFSFDSGTFEPKSFWYRLLSYRRQRLPMGCATTTSQAGIIGMHAYSILDVREIENVGVDFFRDGLLSGSMGNVSGFTDFDGTVRLLRIRNPHGRGEWGGEFSDGSSVWERLLENRNDGPSDRGFGSSAPDDGAGLERTMKNDGTFWIGYDDFLMGFSNVDVVLAHRDMCARSFASNFPPKRSNHRCARAFEVSLLDEQPGVPSRDTVELYVMCIQKTRRGAHRGRSDRKRSYRVCDLGLLVGEDRARARPSAAFGAGPEPDPAGVGDGPQFDTMEGRMFGFRRYGHHRLILDRRKNRSAVVMPISFGHPAATDREMSFALRFVADAPLHIRELPNVPRLDLAIRGFCLGREGPRTVLLEDSSGILLHGEPRYRVIQVDCLGGGGGTVFIYLCVNDGLVPRGGGAEANDLAVSFNVEATCRGMACRTVDGLLGYETVSKGKKFEAAWRRYRCEFRGESRSRLLATLVQSGQDTEMGSVRCECVVDGPTVGVGSAGPLSEFFDAKRQSPLHQRVCDDYETHGIFNGTAYNGSSKSDLAPHMSARANVVSLLGSHDDFDAEMERALALSRGDLEFQRALERSRDDVGVQDMDGQRRDASGKHTLPSPSDIFDRDMETAILASTQYSIASSQFPASATSSVAQGSGRKIFSQEVEEAMKLSLEETKKPSRRAGNSAVIDITSAPLASAKIRGGDQEIIEIIDEPDSRKGGVERGG